MICQRLEAHIPLSLRPLLCHPRFHADSRAQIFYQRELHQALSGPWVLASEGLMKHSPALPLLTWWLGDLDKVSPHMHSFRTRDGTYEMKKMKNYGNHDRPLLLVELTHIKKEM